MNLYSIQIWLLMFFTYSALGWIWEVCYVSLKNKKWTNRGFLFGPALPIYGFGAIIILFSTFPFKENLLLLYFIGTLSATILELITGYVMELIFHTRYWDYSYKKYHYKGYICLSSTIAWGFFAIILVKGINVPIESFILSLNTKTIDYLTIILVVLFTVDVTNSTINAFNLKKLLQTIKENNSNVADVILHLENISSKLSENKDELFESISIFKEQISNNTEENFNKLSEKYKLIELKIYERISSITSNFSNEINAKFKDNSISETEKEKSENILSDLSNFKNKLLSREFPIKNLDLKEYKGAIKQLKRNPSAYSEKLKDEIKQIKNLK